MSGKQFTLHIGIPIFSGAGLYYLFVPKADFVRLVDAILPSTVLPAHVQMNLQNLFLQFLRFYLPDMLWAYALTFAVYFCFESGSSAHRAAEQMKTLVITMVFSAGMEFLQLHPYVRGTFDPMDVVLEFLAEFLAFLIIRIIEKQ